MIRLVCGPPGAGKSTLVDEQKKPGDLVVDLDRIRASGVSDDVARALRGVMEEKAREHTEGDVWIVRTLADPIARAEFSARVGVDETTVLDTDATTAKARVLARDGNEERFPAIDRWWADYTPDTGETEATDMDQSQEQNTSEGVEQQAEDHEEQPTSGTSGDKGFPAETRISDMTVEQQAAYWKYHARRHETRAKELETAAKEASAEQSTENQEEPEGSATGDSERDAVLHEIFDARFDAATSNFPDHDFGPLKEHLNVESFKGEDGRIDKEKINALIQSLPTGQNTNHHEGLPNEFGNAQSYEGARGVDLGRELFKARGHH